MFLTFCAVLVNHVLIMWIMDYKDNSNYLIGTLCIH